MLCRYAVCWQNMAKVNRKAPIFYAYRVVQLASIAVWLSYLVCITYTIHKVCICINYAVKCLWHIMNWISIDDVSGSGYSCDTVSVYMLRYRKAFSYTFDHLIAKQRTLYFLIQHQNDVQFPSYTIHIQIAHIKWTSVNRKTTENLFCSFLLVFFCSGGDN